MRPLTGVDALIQELSDMRQRLAALENDPRRSGSGGATVPTAGAQFNPQVLGTVTGFLADSDSGDLDANGLPLFTPINWTKVTSDYEITTEGNRIQLNADGLWMLLTTIAPHYGRFGHKNFAQVGAAITEGGNLAGHMSPTPAGSAKSTAPGEPYHDQHIGYGNSFAMSGFAGTVRDAVQDPINHTIFPLYWIVTVELHRLIEG